MMRQNDCSSREKLMREINEVSFAVNDIHLFLDTHLCDEKALAYYEGVVERRKKLMNEYARTYGPLTINDAVLSGGDTWKWMEQPFPWEKEGA